MTKTMIEGRLFGPRYHTVADSVVVRRLATDLDEHVGRRWFALVMFGDGRWIARPAAGSPGREVPAPTLHLLQRMAAVLNVQVAHDGHWVLAVTPAHEAVALWRDADGDIHVALEFDQKVQRLHSWTDDQIAGQAAAALNLYRAQAAKVDVAPGQMIRRALGEAPARH